MWSSDPTPPQAEGTSEQTATDYVPPEKRQKAIDAKAFRDAFEACRNQELGIQEAALLFGVNKRKLRAKLRSSGISVIDETYRVFVLPIFPEQAEIDVAGYLQELICSHVHMTNIEVRRLGYELLRDKYKVSPLPQDKNCVLGQKWYKTMMAKYPHLDMEHPAVKANQGNPTSFYDSLENVVAKYGIDASTIFYADAIDLKYRACSVEDPGYCPRRKTIYADSKALCCASPVGNFVPPIFLKPLDKDEPDSKECDVYYFDDEDDEEEMDDEEEEEEIEDDDPDDPLSLGTVCGNLKKKNKPKPPSIPTETDDIARIQQQIKAHLSKKPKTNSEENFEEFREKLQEQFCELKYKMNSKNEVGTNHVTPELFLSWFVRFLDHVKPSGEKRILILLRDQTLVKTFKTLELAKTNGILFLVLPPHSVQKIYPLDGFTMSLCRNLTTEAKRWMGEHPNFKPNQVPLFSFFRKAYGLTANPLIAKNGFLYSGLWPVNRNIFQSSELGGASQLLQKSFQTGVGDACLNPGTGTESLLPGIATEADLQKLCRVCMKETMYTKPLFQPPPSSELNHHGKKLVELTNIPVIPGDGLPSCICQYCLVKLMDATKTREMAAESHRKQIKLLEAFNKVFCESGQIEDRELLLILQEFTRRNYARMINKLLTKTFDMNSICRVCMKEKPLMTSIFFKPQDGTTYCEETRQKIMEVSQRQIHIQDGMSAMICPFCRAAINQAYEFIHRVLSSNQRFNEILEALRMNC